MPSEDNAGNCLDIRAENVPLLISRANEHRNTSPIHENYRSIQARNDSVTASGRSIVDRWPQSCRMSSFDPAIPSAIVRAAETGVSASSLPTSTSVGQWIAPNDGRESGLDMIALCLGAATSAHAEKPTDPQTELIVNLAVITASVDRCHFEIDSRIIALDLLKELMLIEDAPPGARYHYNVASALTTGANAVQGAYDEDPREWCESTWRDYGPDGVTKKGWITRQGSP